MDRPEVLVVETGSANLASVLAGLSRAGADPRPVGGPSQVASAPFIVLPGVGAFGPAVERLRAGGFDEALRRRIDNGRPTLAVCLGLQLLCRESEESPGVRGLSVIDLPVCRFRGDVRVPQMGWNRVAADPACRLLDAGYAYFANSYRLDTVPAGWSAAATDHGGRFVAALEKGPVLACQFHPELSGSWGIRLLRRWLGLEGRAAAC